MRKERQKRRNEPNVIIVETWRGHRMPQALVVREHADYDSGTLFLRPDGGKLRPISIGKGYHPSSFKFFPGIVCVGIKLSAPYGRDTPAVTVMTLQKAGTLWFGEDVCIGKIIADASQKNSEWKKAIPEKFHRAIEALLHRMTHPEVRGPIWAESELY